MGNRTYRLHRNTFGPNGLVRPGHMGYTTYLRRNIRGAPFYIASQAAHSKYASARETDQAFRDRRNCRPTKRCASESPTLDNEERASKKTAIDDAEFDGAL
jgi:hypothetical protein